jgi:hypothetical protein
MKLYYTTFRIICTLTILIASTLFSQTVDLSGRVADKDNRPIFGVIATLEPLGISDTTGSDGVYHLQNYATSFDKDISGSASTNYRNKCVFVIGDKPLNVVVSIFNMQGRLVGTLINTTFNKGTYLFQPLFFSKINLAVGTYVMCLCVSKQFLYKRIFSTFSRSHYGNNQIITSISEENIVFTSRLSKTTSGNSLLTLLKDGQLISQQEIENLIDTIPDLFFIQRNIYGSFNDLAPTTPFIKAILSGTGIPDSTPKIVDLWYNTAANSYSGYVYFVYSAGEKNYSVTTKVYNSLNRLIAQSFPVPFTSNAGDVQIPNFSTHNAVPFCNAGSDTTVSIQDTIKLHASAVDSAGGTIIKYEWKIADGIWFAAANSDTNILAPTTTMDCLCSLRVVDNDSNYSFDTKIVHVELDPPIANAGLDDTVLSKSTYLLKGSASQQFGIIKKWEWSINSEPFSETIKDTTIITPVDYVNAYPCILRVTDDDNNIGLDTINLRIVSWEVIGNIGFSGEVSRFPNLEFINNELYVAYCSSDLSITPKITRLMQFNGTSWVQKGDSIMASVVGRMHTLAVGNILYVAFYDTSEYLRVMKLNGNVWEDLEASRNHALDLSITSNDDTIFTTIGGNGFTTRKYNGITWQTISPDFIPTGFPSYWSWISMQIYHGNPYFAFQCDVTDSYKASVVGYDGTSLRVIGQRGFSDGTAQRTQLVIDNDSLYVSFIDVSNGYRATVMKFNGTSWVPLGQKAFTNDAAMGLTLQFFNHVPYVAFIDGTNTQNKISVMRFTGTNWSYVGEPFFPEYTTDHSDISLRFHNGAPYVSFNSDFKGATVMRHR